MLLKLEPEHDVAGGELGMSHAGEIAALARIAQPEVGVVTDVAAGPSGILNSVAEIARAKYELSNRCPSQARPVLNGDNEYVFAVWRNFKGKVVTYGFGPASTVRAKISSPGGDKVRILTWWLEAGRSMLPCPRRKSQCF